MANVLVLDIGSSSTRAMLFDERANLVPGAMARQPFNFQVGSDGRSEDDPERAFERVVSVMDELQFTSPQPPSPIPSMGISSYACSLLCLDEQGRPLTPVYTYADTRSASDARTLRAQVDEMATLQRTGCRIRANYLPSRMTWIKRTMPEVFRRTRWFASLSDYVALRLFGQMRAGISVWSWSGLLNRQSRDWDREWLELLGISAEQLPGMAAPGEWLGPLQLEYLRRWPMLEDVRCLPAVGDGAAANIGSGCADDRHVAVTIGTTAAMRIVGQNVGQAVSLSGDMTPNRAGERGQADSSFGDTRSRLSGHGQANSASGTSYANRRLAHGQANSLSYIPPALWAYRVDHERALIGGATTEGGNVFGWLSQALNLPEPQVLEDAMRAMQPDAHGLTILPLFAGERGPGYSEDSRATLHGLTLNTGPQDIARACLEAIACRLGLIYDDLRSLAQPDATLVASGGALLASPTWCQIIADVTGAPLRVCEEPEATSRGVAMLVLARVLNLSGLRDLTGLTRLGETYEPDPQRYDVYQAATARQQALYGKLI